MVKFINIIKVIEQNIIKCGPTIDKMRQALSEMSYDEQFKELKNQNLLNPMEIKDYEETLDKLSIWTDDEYEHIKNSEMLSNFYKNRIEEYERNKENLFYYGRRLFEGIEHNEPPVIDRDKFNIEWQIRDFQFLTTGESVGELERKQIKNQEKLIGGDFYDENVWHSVHSYYGGNLHSVEKDLRHGEYLKDVYKQYQKWIKDLDMVIDSTDGLTQDTVLYMGGHLDNIHLNVGDHGKFKGHMSTSYQGYIAELFQHKDIRPNNFIYKIYAPKGTKGLCGNAKECYGGYNVFDEHEYTLPRNIGYTVLDIDYKNNVVEIVLDNPKG